MGLTGSINSFELLPNRECSLVNNNQAIGSTIIELDPGYSTTRRVSRSKPVIGHSPEDKILSVLILPPNSERNSFGGLRTQGYFKHNQPDKPLISVITAVFNGVDHPQRHRSKL